MGNLVKALVGAQLFVGVAASASDIAITINPEPGAPPPSEVYYVRAAGGTEEIHRFDLQGGTWRVSIPAAPPQSWTIRIRYNNGVSPNALKLELWVDPRVRSQTWVLPRPHRREDCHLDDQNALTALNARRAEARDALAIIVQIDHLLAIVRYPCPGPVRNALTAMRLENVRYLQTRTAIRSM